MTTMSKAHLYRLCLKHKTGFCFVDTPARLIHMQEINHSYVRHDSFIYVTWLIHTCCQAWRDNVGVEYENITKSYVRRLLHMCDLIHSYWSNETPPRRCLPCTMLNNQEPEGRGTPSKNENIIKTYVWRLLHMCELIHSYVQHDACIHAACRIYTCDMTPSYVRHASIHMYDLTRSHMRRDPFPYATWIFTCATWLIYMCDMTDSHVRLDSFIYATWFMLHMWMGLDVTIHVNVLSWA